MRLRRWSQHPKFGWTLHDALPNPTIAQYRAELSRLSAALVARRHWAVGQTQNRSWVTP